MGNSIAIARTRNYTKRVIKEIPILQNQIKSLTKNSVKCVLNVNRGKSTRYTTKYIGIIITGVKTLEEAKNYLQEKFKDEAFILKMLSMSRSGDNTKDIEPYTEDLEKYRDSVRNMNNWEISYKLTNTDGSNYVIYEHVDEAKCTLPNYNGDAYSKKYELIRIRDALIANCAVCTYPNPNNPKYKIYITGVFSSNVKDELKKIFLSDQNFS